MTQPPPGLCVETRDGSLVSGRAVPGESWYDGALRLLRAHGVTAEQPDAADLSGAVKRFVCTETPRIGYRPMMRADLAVLVAWQAAPHVARWWSGHAATVEAAERRYGARIDGLDPTRLWVIEVAGRSVGWVQDYRIGDHPDFAILTGEPDAIGLDYAIGDPAWVGRGAGTRALWVFLRDVLRRRHPAASTYLAAPDHRNTASRRVLAKLGFEEGLWFDEPEADGSVRTVVSCTMDVSVVLGRTPEVTYG